MFLDNEVHARNMFSKNTTKEMYDYFFFFISFLACLFMPLTTKTVDNEGLCDCQVPSVDFLCGVGDTTILNADKMFLEG